MRHFDAWVVRDPYSIWHYYSTGRRWQDTVRTLIQERKICSPTPSDPETPHTPTTAATIHSQPTSSLLTKLPPEIRLMIWSYVFGSSTLHLVTLKDKIRHVRCENPSPLTQHRHCCPVTPARWRVYDGRSPGHSDRLLYPHTHTQLPASLSSTASLLYTCRAIHDEAIDLLYTENTFDVDDLYTFIAFAHAIGPRLHSIRKLIIQWMPVWTPLSGKDHKGSIYAHTHSDALWTEFWSVVSSMRGLKELNLSIDLGRFTGTISGGGAIVVAGQRIPLLLTEAWLLPLLNVRGLSSFEMAVTARCDAAAKGVIEGDLIRDAGTLRDQLRAVMCAGVGVGLAEIEGVGIKELGCALEALKEEELGSRRNGRLAITAA